MKSLRKWEKTGGGGGHEGVGWGVGEVAHAPDPAF